MARPSLRSALLELSLLVPVSIAALLIVRPEVSFAIPEAEAEARAAEKLPLVIDKGIATLTVTAVDLDFLASNEVRVRAEVDVAGAGLDGHASLDATSGLRYEDGRFYLADATLDEVTLTPTAESEARIADAGASGERLWDRMKAGLAGNDPEAGSALGRMKSRALEAAFPVLQEKMGEVLTDTPVYSLENRGLKGWAARAALIDVSFTDASAVARLDPGRLLLHGMGQVALLILACLAGFGMLGAWMQPSRS
jgi:hypothetical protein